MEIKLVSSPSPSPSLSSPVRGGLRMFKLDRECAMVGGICMDVDDCDPEYLSTTTGLCPSSSAYNVQCCYRCECYNVILLQFRIV